MVGARLLIYKANRLAKKHVRECSLPYDKAKDIGIIFTVDDLDKHMQVKEFIKKIKQSKKNVEVLCYLPKDKENYEFIFNFFTEKDISFWGSFTNNDVLNFTNRPFDFLFCLDCNPNPLVESVMAMTKASCRVGCYSSGKDQYYELMIQPKRPTTENLVDEIFRYVKILR